MHEIKFKIEMLSDWHVGSGLDSGTDADALVLKDENDLPYLPGKTLKGLLKDALMDINEVQSEKIPKSAIEEIFGKINEDNSTEQGNAFFSNVYLPEREVKEIVSNDLSAHLYRNISSTAIGRKGFKDELEGIAKEKSLRTKQVTIPVTLSGTISGLKDGDQALFDLAFKWLRHLGVNRNRGLGRCKISQLEKSSS